MISFFNYINNYSNIKNKNLYIYADNHNNTRVVMWKKSVRVCQKELYNLIISQKRSMYTLMIFYTFINDLQCADFSDAGGDAKDVSLRVDAM